MRERLLEVEAARHRDLFDFRAQEIIVPRLRRVVVRGRIVAVEPDFDGDQQPLRRADLEFVKTDFGVDRQRFEQNSRRANLEPLGHQALEPDFAAAHCGAPPGARNWTSRSSAMKRWPPSTTIVWPVTAVAPAR